MKTCLLNIAILLFLTNAMAQGKYDANWVFGVKAGINFDNTPNPVNFYTLCNTAVGAACISDSEGNLLFYISPDTPFNIENAGSVMDDDAIFSSNNQVINKGDSILGGGDLTGAVFLPVPYNPSSYYLFYMQRIVDSMSDYENLYYCRIDVSENGYEVAQKDQLLLNAPLEWGLAAAKNADGNGWWLIMHRSDSFGAIPNQRFYEFQVTGSSILGPDSQDIGSIHYSEDVFGSNIHFSKKGDMLAISLVDQNGVDFFNFSRCNGQLSNFFSITNIDPLGDDEIVSCEFSEDESKLYISEGYSDVSGKSALYQYLLTSDTPIISSKTVLWQTDSSQTNFGDLRMAPNNKIYLAVEYGGGWPYQNTTYNQFNQYLWVINDPDSAGAACNFQPYGYYLGDSGRVYWALPNMPNYNLGPLNSLWASTVSGDTSFCFGDTAIKGVPLQVDTAPGVSFQWQPGPGIDSLNAAHQYVLPTQSTWYYVTFTDTTIVGSCQSRTDSVYVQVIHCCDSLLLQQCTLSKDTFICTDEDTPTKGATLQIDTVPGASFTWQPGFDIDTNHVTNQIVDPPQSTWYYCTFYVDTYYEASTCRRTDSVYVEVKKCDTTGIQQVNNSIERLIIYPNPAQNMVTVEWQDDNAYNEATLMIYDVLGREVSSQQINSGKADPSTTLRMTLDVSGLENGLYVVKVMSLSGGGVGGGILGSAKLAVIK